MTSRHITAAALTVTIAECITVGVFAIAISLRDGAFPWLGLLLLVAPITAVVSLSQDPA